LVERTELSAADLRHDGRIPGQDQTIATKGDAAHTREEGTEAEHVHMVLKQGALGGSKNP